MPTTADLLALPDDGIERWLVDGEIEEVGPSMRDKWHSRVAAELCYTLGSWLEAQPKPRGALHAGEVGVILRSVPELTVGIDLVYLNPRQAGRTDRKDETSLIVGPITLAVEVLSPSDTFENIHRKLACFAQCGVPVTWLVNAYLRTVAVHRPGVPPVTFNEQQELDGGAELPGFRLPVARLFER